MTSSSCRLYNRTVLLWICARSDNIYCKAAWLSELKDPPDCDCAVIGRLLGLGTSDNNDNNDDDNNNDDNNICKNNNSNNNNNKLPQIGAYFSGTCCSLAICANLSSFRVSLGYVEIFAATTTYDICLLHYRYLLIKLIEL